MENLSRVFQKQTRKNLQKIGFHNSVQDLVFTTIYQYRKVRQKMLDIYCNYLCDVLANQ